MSQLRINPLPASAGFLLLIYLNIIAYSLYDGTNLDAISSNRIRPDNTSGVRGVAMTKSGRWRAYISFKREQRNLGTFDTLEEAADARKNAERELYHPVLKAHGIEPVEDDDA